MLSRRQLLQTSLVATAVSTFAIKRARAAEYSMKWGSSLAASHPVNVRLKEACEAIKEDSKGRMEIAVFSDGQLGGDSDMLAQVRTGALEFYNTAGITIAALVPAAGIITMPFAFKDYDAVWTAMDGDLGKHVASAINKVNLHVFDRIWDNGYRQITSNSRAIKTPDDLKGFKIRVPSSPLNTSLFQNLGASPTILNVNDVYMALQTGVIDGQENPLVTIATFKFDEVQKYCALSNHVWDGFIQVANPRVWKDLPKDLQEIVTRNVNSAALKQREDVKNGNDNVRKQLQEKGMAFNEVDQAAFRAVLKDAKFYQEWQKKFGQEAWSTLEKYSGPLV